MKIILRQEVKGLGDIGDVKSVSDGYARNYLLPRALGMLATDDNLKLIEKEKKLNAVKAKKDIEAAQKYAGELSRVSVTLTVESKEDDKIFGSVSSADIAEALKGENFTVDKKDILLDSPIKALGAFDVEIKVHPSVNAKIKVWVVSKEKTESK
jgi:large subunit ribosomal protein L9